MAANLSPGIFVTETDQSTTVQAVGTSIGAIGINAVWGPVNYVVTVSSENELVQTFGNPNDTTYQYFFAAKSFLDYSSDLKVVRVIDSTAAGNANSSSSLGLIIQNVDDYNTNTFGAGKLANAGLFVAKYPGVLGNSLGVSIVDACASSTGALSYSSQTYFGSKLWSGIAPKPTTTASVANANGSNDAFHALVIDTNGAWTGTAGQILEKFLFISKASDAVGYDGTNNYYVNVLNNRSQYVWAASAPSASSIGTSGVNKTFGYFTTVAQKSNLGGGADSTNDTNIQAALVVANGGYNLFSDLASTPINLMISGPANAATTGSLIALAASWANPLLFISPKMGDVVGVLNAATANTNVLAYQSSLSANTSFVVMDNNWKYLYDSYNDVFRWVPCNGDIAGLCARTDSTNAAWFSPAGYTRGTLKNCIKLAYNPNQTQRDALYIQNVNPITTFPAHGTILFGDKTAYPTPSAFQSIPIRRMFTLLETTIADFSRSLLFEQNDQTTRNAFIGAIEPLLRTVQAGRGITDFKVVCDASNNTNVDPKTLVGDIYIKPTYSVNFIQLNFIATRNSVNFSTVGA